MFLVMGITGKVGGATAEHLLAHGKEVRALVRNREKASDAKSVRSPREGPVSAQPPRSPWVRRRSARHPTRQLAPTAMNAGFAPHRARSRGHSATAGSRLRA
jgi:uncharacterized protein YbjT (DUF2867 family)